MKKLFLDIKPENCLEAVRTIITGDLSITTEVVSKRSQADLVLWMLVGKPTQASLLEASNGHLIVQSRSVEVDDENYEPAIRDSLMPILQRLRN